MTEDQQRNYAGIILLHALVSGKKKFPVILRGSEQVLEPVLLNLLKDERVEVKRGDYVATEKGRRVIDEKLRVQYTEFLDIISLFCAVDLSAEAAAAQDQFAYQKFYDDAYQDDAVWAAYLALPRWTDLRVAVAEFKKINPVDVVFLSFLKKGRFSATKPNWEADLVLGDIWNDMLKVVNSAWHVENFASPDDVRLIVETGTSVKFELLKIRAEIEAEKRAAEQAAAQANQGQANATAEEVVIEEYYIDDPLAYYNPWWDPYYVSPLWTVPLWVLI